MMVKDPLMVWPGGFPYDLLAEAGITPQSSMQEVKDALYHFMKQGAVPPEIREAWDQLRMVEKRLWVDMFLYPAGLSLEGIPTLSETDREEIIQLVKALQD